MAYGLKDVFGELRCQCGAWLKLQNYFFAKIEKTTYKRNDKDTLNIQTVINFISVQDIETVFDRCCLNLVHEQDALLVHGGCGICPLPVQFNMVNGELLGS